MLRHPAILKRLLDPKRGSFPPELARQILELDFARSDHVRYKKLSAKARKGTLTPNERLMLEDYLNLSDFLTILRTKAEASLRKNTSVA